MCQLEWVREGGREGAGQSLEMRMTSREGAWQTCQERGRQELGTGRRKPLLPSDDGTTIKGIWVTRDDIKYLGWAQTSTSLTSFRVIWSFSHSLPFADSPPPPLNLPCVCWLQICVFVCTHAHLTVSDNKTNSKQQIVTTWLFFTCKNSFFIWFEMIE